LRQHLREALVASLIAIRRVPADGGATVKAFGALPVPGGESGGFRYRLPRFNPQPLFLGAEIGDD
jgi:hypothetical protein